jgi:hypothetical protein
MMIGKTLARTEFLRQSNDTLEEKRPVAIQHVPETDSGVQPDGVKLRRKAIKTSKLGFFRLAGNLQINYNVSRYSLPSLDRYGRPRWICILR